VCCRTCSLRNGKRCNGTGHAADVGGHERRSNRNAGRCSGAVDSGDSGKLTDQFKTALAIVLPFTSVAVATKCCFSPTLMVALIGEIDTEATSGKT